MKKRSSFHNPSLAALLQVNIDYKMREDIVDHLKFNKNVSVFSEAQHQVYRLMHRDSYPRFLTSSLFADLVKEVKGK